MKEAAKKLANNASETAPGSTFREYIRKLFRAWLQKHLGISSLFLLDIEDFLSSNEDRLSDEQKKLFKAIIGTIDSLNTISQCDVRIPDVTTEEELLSKTLGDIFPGLKSDFNSFANPILGVYHELRQKVNDIQGDDGIVQELKAEILKVIDESTIPGKIQSLKDELDKELSSFGPDDTFDIILDHCKELKFSDLSHRTHSSGIIERVIQKIKGLEIGGVLIGLVIVLLVYCTMEETAESSTKAGKGLDRGLYYVSVIGGLAYLVWVVGSSYCYDEVDEVVKGAKNGTRWKGLTGVMSMVPIVVGVLSVGGESREGITMGMVSAGVVAAQHFVGDEMRWREIVAAAVGSGLVCVVYFDVMWNFLGDGVGLYYVWTLMVVFVCMLVGGRYMWRESFRIGAVLRYVVFMVTLVVSTAISWSGVCVCPSVSGCDREID
ncbi:DUF1686 domain-containing protein [Encephalitozoon hellem]|uniref:DUF1686 domain-containing protein n=1 Tax=Encephalitozoon hellem TaxID=27973 RepID=A0A9Q9C1D0_ENCHE|nr:DUF1686 domain-containing protein [Encephalitozoon hellem]